MLVFCTEFLHLCVTFAAIRMFVTDPEGSLSGTSRAEWIVSKIECDSFVATHRAEAA